MNARRLLNHWIGLIVLLGMIFALGAPVSAAQKSPFVGNWVTTDGDGSEMTLVIGGPVNGPFKLTWTDDYFSFCNGTAGILRGTAILNPEDANLLEADMHLQCFTTGDVLDYHTTLRYHPIPIPCPFFTFQEGCTSGTDQAHRKPLLHLVCV